MNLWEEMLCKILREGVMEIRFPQAPDLNKLLESKCYQALAKIKSIIENEELEDSECFMKIEEIVYALEEIGSNGGSRHDFS